MKKLIFLFLVFVPFLVISQNNIPCRISLKNGKTIPIHHFGYLKCGGKLESKQYEDVIQIRGYYEISNNYRKRMTITDYSQIKRIELKGFNRKPKYGYGLKKRYEKEFIKIFRNTQSGFTLEFAYLIHTCSGTYSDGSNQLRLQVLNPTTQKIEELILNTNEIKYIEF